MRVASLLPSTTEIVCALGLGDTLVARSHECDFPSGVEALPAVTETLLDPEQPGARIDRDVRDLVERGLSIYRVDAEALRGARPDVILTQDHCAVCAASLADVEAALANWLGATPQVLSLSPLTLGDVWADLQRVAQALGVPERGAALAAELASTLTDLAERAQACPTRPRVACIEWIEPLMSAGNWMPELVRLAGGEPLLGQTGAHSPFIDADALVAADPDAIVIVPCGFDLARTRAEWSPLRDAPWFQELRAVRDGRVALADGNAYFNRPGPRLVDSLGLLCEMLHPEAFAPGEAVARGAPAWEPA